MHAIASNLPIDVSCPMFNLILKASLDNSSRAYLSFRLLVTDFLAQHLIVPEPHETLLMTGKPILRITLRMSNAHLRVAPPPPQLRSHVVDLIPSNDEAPSTPLVAIDIPSTSTTPPPAALATASDPKIAEAIAALFAHIDVIHKDLVECIGLVHEQVDLIVERQSHDIKAIRDTLSAYLIDTRSLSWR
ncbi:hypothetical protein Acr_00g0051290 [Actinidia rufa]|uniref:Uncharacterized protein n=1 Tax=Actinidia rufa TaxID=165716 RepID=A0A7J0DKR8_9ERIC|nr:hypothetical protein Acr_00g0051290 [Actinidia rufa]